MLPISMNELIPILQVAIGPVVLVSGVGLLLLTMTNRLARVIDRSRLLSLELRQGTNKDSGRVLSQLKIFSKRASIIQRAITLASLSVLLAAILVIVLFLATLLRWEVAWLISAIFILGMITLIGSLIDFIRDINHSLLALRLELQDVSLDAPEKHADKGAI